MARPDLAAQVRSFYQDNDPMYYKPQAVPRSRRARGQAWLGQFEGVDALDEMHLGQWLLESVLTRLPNANQLIIKELSRLYASAAVVEFSSITRLAITRPIGFGNGQLRNFLSMLPRLEELAVSVDGGITEFLPLAELRSLDLYAEGMGAKTLTAIVSSCPKLERFGYHNLTLGALHMPWNQVQSILQQRTQTLKHVKFTTDEHFLEERDAVPAWRGSFRGFDGLETL